MRHPFLKPWLPSFLALFSFAVYLATMCPVVYLGDSGELTAAAFSLGIPHASGYPLYTLIGKLFCLIPLGNIGFRMNVMSACFAALTVWLVYAFIRKRWDCPWAAFMGASLLAFLPVFWSQTVSAEVYSLHVFFVALLIRLLWWWDEKKSFFRLVLFVFVTGISFGNHLQTVMLAPAVLFLVFSGDRKLVLEPRRFIILTVFFILPLFLYLLLPIRTDAGAAIHWGDPNTLERFWAHVSASAHRHGYVLNKTPAEYLSRTMDTFRFVWSQFGVVLLLSFWGWLKLSSARWKIFFVLVVVFDIVYTVFLNIISLEVTAFTLPSSIVLAMLAGGGAADILRRVRRAEWGRGRFETAARIACCLVPAPFLILNFSLCDQSRNYTAYEHAVNIFRTLDSGNTLILDGDNNVFPVVYGRMVERMRYDVTLFDRHNLFFKWSLAQKDFHFCGSWDEFRSVVEKKIIRERAEQGVYFSVFAPFSIEMPPGYFLVPFGVLSRIIRNAALLRDKTPTTVWRYYATQSYMDDFERDYMNREVAADFWFRRGKYLVLLGKRGVGLKNLKMASRIAYDGTRIHSELAVFLVDNGFFKEARRELEQASRYHENLAGLYNNWGYYYNKVGDYNRAEMFFRKAISKDPGKTDFYNNLALVLYEKGEKGKALQAVKKSLSIDGDQPRTKKFMEEKLIEQPPS